MDATWTKKHGIREAYQGITEAYHGIREAYQGREPESNTFLRTWNGQWGDSGYAVSVLSKRKRVYRLRASFTI